MPALREYPEDLIIVIDDDLMYRVDFVENLYKGYLAFPKGIIASRVHQITLNENGKIAPYIEWKKECTFDLLKKRNDWFFTSGAGILFPPHIFYDTIHDWEKFKNYALMLMIYGLTFMQQF